MDIPTLATLIHENGGRLLWDAETQHDPPQFLRAYNVGGKLIVVHDMRDDGWDIYAPVSSSNEVGATLKAAGLTEVEEFADSPAQLNYGPSLDY